MARASQGRKIIFFLGAGASRGAGAFAPAQHGARIPIPIQEDFWPVFLRYCKKKENKKLIERFLFRYFLGYKKVPSRAHWKTRRNQLSGINVEEVFTFLSERARAPSVTTSMRTTATTTWAALVEEITNVFGKFSANQKTRNIYRAFSNNHIRSRDVIVSFNYDTVFESSLSNQTSFVYEGVNEAKNSLRILKPHGSINWNLNEQKRISISPSPENPILIAPTHLKFIAMTNHNQDQVTKGYLDQCEQIDDVWRLMERHMKESKALVFIGYSFPDADLYFASVLRTVLAVSEPLPCIVLVNPDSLNIRNRLQERFAAKNIISFFDLSQFVDVGREGLLRRL